MTGAASHVVLDRVTGFGAKWLELVKEIAPRVRRVGFMFNPDMSPYSALFYRSLETAAQNLAVEPVVAAVRQSADIEAAMTTLSSEPNGGLILPPDPFTIAHRKQIGELAIRCRARSTRSGVCLPMVDWFPMA